MQIVHSMVFLAMKINNFKASFLVYARTEGELFQLCRMLCCCVQQSFPFDLAAISRRDLHCQNNFGRRSATDRGHMSFCILTYLPSFVLRPPRDSQQAEFSKEDQKK